MTNTAKKRDDEKLQWLIAGGLLTGTLIGLDVWYSSFGSMHLLLLALVGVLHLVLVSFWAVIMSKFNDPNYDTYRKYACALSAVLILIVGIHHATEREDKQVIIDSNNNKESTK